MKQVDILIRNGFIYDGFGSEPYLGDIGITGDRISFVDRPANIEKERGVRGRELIDAKGLVVAPGFIDVHAHSEFTLLADPRAEGKICQGITTEINGNCGLSSAPLYGEALIQRENDLREFDIKDRWTTFIEYFTLLEKRHIALNYATLTGHGNLRACVTGYQDKRLSENESEKMRLFLNETTREGSIGLSTGLIYPPGVYSETEELIDLCKILNNREDGRAYIYTSHMRSEGDNLLESIQEIIRIANESGIGVHISHIKTSGDKNWHKIDAALTIIDEARNRGVRITCDRYPYTAASTDLDTVLPPWTYEGGSAQEIDRLRNPEVRNKIKREILSCHPEQKYWENIYITSVSPEKNKWMEGKSIASVSRHANCEAVDMLFRILIEEKLRVGAIFSSMSEENLRRFLKLPYLMIGTDSSARSGSGPTCRGKPHPRGFGSFPRFLGRYVRDSGLMSMGEAIRRITILPAQTFGIRERGVLRKGAFADITVFDYEKIMDRATFEEPFLKPDGIHHVFVNGVPVVREGEMTENRPGRVLRHGGALTNTKETWDE